METTEKTFSSNESGNYKANSTFSRNFIQNQDFRNNDYYTINNATAASEFNGNGVGGGAAAVVADETKPLNVTPVNTTPMYTQRTTQPVQPQSYSQTAQEKDTSNSSEIPVKVTTQLENVSKEQNSPGSNASTASQQSAASSTSNSGATDSMPVLPPTIHNVPTVHSVQRPLHAMIPMCVYLMSRVAIKMEIEDTASCPAKVICAAVLHSEDVGVTNRALASQVFCLWMTSPLLELQLKPLHKPFEVRRAWPSMLGKFSHGTINQQRRDEPIVVLQRNVFFPKQNEDKIKDPKVLELLYEEARHNVLGGRYPCEQAHCIMLGGIQARIELGPYNPQAHTVSFFREKQGRFLPAHVRKSENWSWLPISSKHSAEVRLLEQFKRVPNAATTRKLMRKYLEFCWALPFYGAAFFHGQIEQPISGLVSIITRQDIPVLVALNQQGIYIIDDLQCTLLLGLKYDELSWDFAKPSREADPECLQCLFLQFAVLENGARVYKVLQIFSKQAAMMDVLISSFIEEMKKSRSAANIDEMDRPMFNPDQEVSGNASGSNSSQCCLSNKLSRLNLATFDEEGQCIGKMGSFHISY